MYDPVLKSVDSKMAYFYTQIKVVRAISYVVVQINK